MKSSTRFKSNHKGIECLNCKQPIASVDNFCSNCGQVNDTKPLSIKQFITELLGGFFAFDTRTLNTLKPLLLKPGKVTKEYINGERKKYVNPFQLYLHVSIIFFLVTSIFMGIDAYNSMVSKKNATDDFTPGWNDSEKPEKKLKISSGNSGWSLSYKKTDSTTLKPTLKQIIISSENLANDKKFIKIITDTILSLHKKDIKVSNLLEKRVTNLYENLLQKESFKKDSLYDENKFKKTYIANFQKEIRLKNMDYKVTIVKEPNDIQTSSPWLKKYTRFFNSKTKNTEKALDSLGYKKTDKNIFFFKKLQDLKKVGNGDDATNSFVSNMISKSSLVLFFMLPLFTLFLHLLYIRKKLNYTENLIFVFNVQTVFFILLLLGIVIDRVFDTDFGSSISILVFLFYLYKALRKFYNQKRFKTILKFIILNFVYFILSVFGLMLVAFLAFLI